MALTLGLLEISVRALTNTEHSIVRRDPVLGVTFVKNLNDNVFNGEARESIHLATNSLGFRGPEFQLLDPEHEQRIAFLGDSMIAGAQVVEEATAARQLAELVTDLSGRTTDVLNFGVNTSSTAQELILFREVVADFEPGLVVCAYFVGNDFEDNCSRLTGSPRIYFDLDADGKLKRDDPPETRAAASNWLNEHSRFYVYQKRLIRKRAGDDPGLTGGEHIFLTTPDPTLEHAWKLSETLVRTLHDDVVASGSRFLLLVMPSNNTVHDESWADLLARHAGDDAELDREYPSIRLDATCRQAGIPILDLTGAFRAEAAGRSGIDADLFIGGIGHLTEGGHELVAREMAHFIMAEGLLE